MLGPGDLIFHPSHGFGTVSGLTRRDPLDPIQDLDITGGAEDPTQDYYDIQLKSGGTLLVPVSRAEASRAAPSHQRCGRDHDLPALAA